MGLPVPDRNNPDRNNFRGCESRHLHKRDTKTASWKLQVLARVKVKEQGVGVGVGVGVEVGAGVKEAVYRIPFVLGPLYPWPDPQRAAEDHRKVGDSSHCLYSGTFPSPENRISAVGCRTPSSSAARLLVGPSRARDRRVVVEGRHTSEFALHESLHLAAAGFANSAILLLVCQQDLCKSRTFPFVIMTTLTALNTHYFTTSHFNLSQDWRRI